MNKNLKIDIDTATNGFMIRVYDKEYKDVIKVIAFDIPSLLKEIEKLLTQEVETADVA